MLKNTLFSMTCFLALTAAAHAGSTPNADAVRKLAAEMQASAASMAPDDLTTMPVNPPVSPVDQPSDTIPWMHAPDDATTMPVNPPVERVDDEPVPGISDPLPWMRVPEDTTMPVNPPVELVTEPDLLLGTDCFSCQPDPNAPQIGELIPGTDVVYTGPIMGNNGVDDGEIADIGWVIPEYTAVAVGGL